MAAAQNNAATNKRGGSVAHRERGHRSEAQQTSSLAATVHGTKYCTISTVDSATVTCDHLDSPFD
jgi:hypothetical protein